MQCQLKGRSWLSHLGQEPPSRCQTQSNQGSGAQAEWKSVRDSPVDVECFPNSEQDGLANAFISKVNTSNELGVRKTDSVLLRF